MGVLLLGVFATGFFAFSTVIKTRQPVALPNPNGYDDFVAAAQLLVAWNGELAGLSPDAVSSIVRQNSNVLVLVRTGLKKQSLVPVANDMNWSTIHMSQLAPNKRIALLFAAEGTVHQQEGRTNEAARSFADCVRFAHDAHCGGLMIDQLVAIACQAIGMKHLTNVTPHLAPETSREILRDFIALDRTRESASAILERDRDWVRAVYGTWRSMWARFVTRKTTRDMERKFDARHARSVAAMRLVMTDLALKLYQREKGKWPAALVDLVPAYLPAIPLDPFSNQPLVYRTLTNSFLLYSVGPDKKDDGGKPLKKGGVDNEVETGDLLPTAL
jgi:hypothetical protein